MSTTITSYASRATWSTGELDSVTSSPSSGRSGAGRMWSPLVRVVTSPPSLSASSAPGEETRSKNVCSGSRASISAASEAEVEVDEERCAARGHAIEVARLVATTVLPVPPFGENTVTTRPDARALPRGLRRRPARAALRIA